MRFIRFLPVVMLLLVVSASAQQVAKTTGKKRSNISVPKILSSSPQVQLSVKLQRDTFKSGQTIAFTITATNNSDKTQKFLFDRPGLWGVYGNVIDLETDSSVVSYPSKAVLSSQVYAEKDLEKLYYNLKPGESVSTESILTSIVILNTKEGYLSKGKYQMEIGLNYGHVISNKVVFWVD